MNNLPTRNVARIIVIDADDNVLLVRYEDAVSMNPDGEGIRSYWVPPGGAANRNESLRVAAERELEEETGLVPKVGPLLWETSHTLRFRQGLVDQREAFLLARVSEVTPPVRNRTPEAIMELRWWPLEDLQTSSQRFFPDGFLELLAPIIEGDLPTVPIRI